MRREQLIKSLRRSGISDGVVLAAMSSVPRDRFVDAAERGSAWEDHPLPIGSGQTISQPYVVAYMTQALELEPGSRVLDVGTGCGYQAAVLADCGCEVWTVEVLPELSARARSTLDELGYEAVRTKVGDGHAGWPDAAPFDAILVAAATDEVPQPLLEQLRTPEPGHRGGRLILPLGGRGSQRLVIIERVENGYERRDLLDVRFVPLIKVAE